MEPNKVTAKVTVRPVTPSSPPHRLGALKAGETEFIVNFQDGSGLLKRQQILAVEPACVG